MLASQLQRVIELDNEINRRHRELSDLYDQRANIVTPSASTTQTDDDVPVSTPSPEDWVTAEYRRLSEAWNFYDITIPAFKTLRSRLRKAETVLQDIYTNLPNLRGRMSVVLVPPQKLTGFPVKSSLREQQDFIIASDFVNPTLPQPIASQSWKVLVALTDEEGMYLGDPRTVLSEKKYMFCDYDARGLGMQEYAALSLQERHMFDTNTWTMLLKGRRKGQIIPIASREHGRFTFEFDESDSDFGDDRFRPAIEIKG